MTRINLYPWRVELEVRQKKQFIILLSTASIISLLIMIIISVNYSFHINKQADNNEYINSELRKINQQLLVINELKAQKDALVSRLSVIQEIEHDRYDTLTLFNEIVNLINPMVLLREIKRHDNLIKINGMAESNAEVAKFLRALEISPSFRGAELNQIKVDQDFMHTTPAAIKPVRELKDNNETTGEELNHYFELQLYQNYPDHLAEAPKVVSQGAIAEPTKK